MREVVQKQVIFKKEHTNREIFQYIIDPDAQPLHLAVKFWYVAARAVYLSANVLATILSCLALLILSSPDYFKSSSYTEALNGFNAMEIVVVVFFTIDYILRFFATDKTALEFIAFDYMNVLDVLTTVPFYIQLIIARSGSDPGGLFRFFFVIRMSRVIRLSRYHRGMDLMMEAVRISVPMLLLFWTIAGIAILIISAAIFFAENTRYDQPTGYWYRACSYPLRMFDENFTQIVQPGKDDCVEEVSPIQSISDGMYWAAVIVSLNGFGALTPTTILGKIVAAVTSCVAIMLFVAPATIMTSNYKVRRAEEKRKEITSQLNERTISAMKAQEVLRKEMERNFKLYKQERSSSSKAGGGGGEGGGQGGDKALGDDSPIGAIPKIKRTVSGLSAGARSDSQAAEDADGGAFELEDEAGGPAGPMDAFKEQTKKLKALHSVLPQSELTGKLRLEVCAEYIPVCAFTFKGETRIIYQVEAGSRYVYPPLLKLKCREYVDRPSEEEEEAALAEAAAAAAGGSKTPKTPTPQPSRATTPPVVAKKQEVVYSDDFNVRTAERILTCFIIMDSDEARTAAHRALLDANIIPRDAADGDVLVQADRSGPVNIQHDYEHIYPDLAQIVYLDELYNATATNSDEIAVSFVVVMPHQVGIEESMKLLEHTRLSISVGMRVSQFVYHFPLSMNCIMASRLIREIVPICFIRKQDGHQIAYVHHTDVQMLLEGFCNQFIPTPSTEVLISAPYVADQQVFLALKGCCASIRLEYVPEDAANSCYRSNHLNPQAQDQTLMELDVTNLDSLDDLGYGTRMQLHVPMCEEVRYDAYIEMKPPTMH